MTTESSNPKRYRQWLTVLMLLGGVTALSVCSENLFTNFAAMTAGAPEKDDIVAGSVRGLNYSPDYIHSFSVSGPRGMNGGGGNMIPAGKNGRGEAGERCCIGIPQPWRPNTQLHIEWERDRRPYDRKDDWSEFEVLTATVVVPEYGPNTYGFWAIFLPGDRVKVMVMDGNANGRNSVKTKPTDDDPFLVQGVRDDTQTKELQERYR
ncbi:DUF3304 domain-containing protein [Cupriavidus campinensis]